MKHSITGDSNLLSFYVVLLAAASITIDDQQLPGTTTKYVSGVPSLNALTDQVQVSFTVTNAVGTHYSQTKVASITGTLIEDDDIPVASVPAINEVLSFIDIDVTLANDGYAEQLTFNVTGYNAKDVAGTPQAVIFNSRIDMKSDESKRLTAGNGMAPTVYGNAFDPSQDLKVAYPNELQVLDGKFQRPEGDYSGNLPEAGPNYSTGMGTDIRWCLIDTEEDLDAASGFKVNFQDVVGAWDILVQNIYIQVKVEGSTGWLDANAAYALDGSSPAADGDACMVYPDSTATSKRITFGPTPRTGRLYIRVGIPNGSDKKFGQDISITDIV